MRILMNNHQIISFMTNCLNKTGFEFLNNQSDIGSISEMNQFLTDKLYKILNNTYNIQETVINGSKKFPSELLHSKKENLILPDEVLNLLVKYYETSYKMNFQRLFTNSINNDSIV